MPSRRIQSLSAQVVNLIAAGEVIDSLVAVVRELAENALDANATHITILLFPKAWRIEVIDNGQGMDLSDLSQCAQPHTTSKIYQLEDLWKITSLGFRGEALHSLAQVAQLEISSRPNTDDSTAGYRFRYDSQGNVEHHQPIALSPGTIVTANNLFGKFPVRRQGFPPLTHQLKAIQTQIQHLALCHPAVVWQVWQEHKLWFSLSSGKSAQQLMPQMLRSLHQGDLVCSQTKSDAPGTNNQMAEVELVMGLPDRCHRHRSDWVKVAINGRIVRLPELEQTIHQAFARTLPRDRFPVCFLHLKLCPSQIDWNRHPAKAEIYLHSLTYWQQRISEAITQLLSGHGESLSTTAQNQRISKLLKMAESSRAYSLGSSILTRDLNSNPVQLIPLKAVAQINKTYIVAEHSEGLWLVEQHIAHERIIFEQLQDRWQIIPLEKPLVLEGLSEKQRQQLVSIGIEVEMFGELLWRVTNAPEILTQRSDCQEAILELSHGGNLEVAQVATACRSAIRNGTTLTLAEMQDLLERWQNTRHPHTCPHGRPIYLSLSESVLARFFRRHWVIGKSHGI